MHLRALALAAAASIFAAAQAPSTQPEVVSHQAPATFNTRVNLVSVPVVVRDNKGHTIGALRQEDFHLFDKGKAQIITKFSIQKNAPTPAPDISKSTAPSPTSNAAADSGAAPSSPLPSQYVAYIFDDIHMNFADIAGIRIAAQKHFDSLAPSTRAAIFTTSASVFLDFTADRDKLREALLRIGPGPHAMPPSRANGELGKYDTCPPEVGLYRADRVLNFGDTRELAAAEAAAVACYGPDPSPPSMGLMISNQVLSAGTVDTKINLASLTDLVRRVSTMPGLRSIILISAGFFVTRDLAQEESALTDAAIRANVTLNALDARGRYTSDTNEANSLGDAMRRLADGTGGKFFENDNGFVEGLKQLATPPEYSYILGFSPQNLKLDGSYHSLKVSLVNSKGLDVQARQGYWAPNHAESEAEQAKEEIREAVFSLEEVRDIPLDLTTEFFKLSETSAELTVQSHLDPHALKFRVSGDRNEDSLTIVTGLFDQDGRYVQGTQRVIDLRLREQTLDKLLSSGMDVKETFDLPPGRYVVRVVARDTQGQTMAARNSTVTIQ